MSRAVTRKCVFFCFYMKTNIVLTSASRELNGVTIRQETKTGFMNLSDLQLSYEKARASNGWSEKRIDHILPQVENRERLYYVLKETDFINVDFDTFMENCDQHGFYKYLKQIGAYKTTGRGANKTTMCNKYIWGLVAMELHPQIYAKVVVWFTDSLVFNRIESGTMYKELSRAVSKFRDCNYPNLAKAINHVVFGRHESDIRNQGTEDQLHELHKLESNLAFSIDSGFINSFPGLMEHIRLLWRKKYNNFY